jgi:FixJ family two-component response regulator
MANRQPHIAVVDDEESVRLALARMLRASSFEVSIYRCGEDFLEALKTTPAAMPDCVVLDFQMPGLTGRDIQRALSVAKLPLPIIIVTAHDQPSLREKALADGAVAYFTKPLRRDTLIAAVEQAIRRAP